MVALVSQENMVTLVSRTGRHLQRYNKGRRQVVGFVSHLNICIFIFHVIFLSSNFEFWEAVKSIPFVFQGNPEMV